MSAEKGDHIRVNKGEYEKGYHVRVKSMNTK
jgi:hypothetical protein